MKRDLVPWFNGKGHVRDLSRRDGEFFSDMYSSMNKAFGDIVKKFGGFGLSKEGFGFNPDFDIRETDHSYDIKAELSGIDENDVDVSLEGNLLRISGEKKDENSEKEGKYHISERKFGSFERVFTLPGEVDSSKIKASFKKGILSVHISKTEKAKTHSKKIEIKPE